MIGNGSWDKSKHGTEDHVSKDASTFDPIGNINQYFLI